MVKVNVPAEVSVHVATISRLLSDPSADGYDEAIDTALGALERMKMSTEILIASGAGKVVNKLRKTNPRAAALVGTWRALVHSG